METLTVTMSGQISAVLGASYGQQSITSAFQQSLAFSVSTGTGEGRANQMYSDSRDLAAGASYIFDLVTFNGSNDGVGYPLAMATVKLLSIQATSGSLVVGGAPVGG